MELRVYLISLLVILLVSDAVKAKGYSRGLTIKKPSGGSSHTSSRHHVASAPNGNNKPPPPGWNLHNNHGQSGTQQKRNYTNPHQTYNPGNQGRNNSSYQHPQNQSHSYPNNNHQHYPPAPNGGYNPPSGHGGNTHIHNNVIVSPVQSGGSGNGRSFATGLVVGAAIGILTSRPSGGNHGGNGNSGNQPSGPVSITHTHTVNNYYNGAAPTATNGAAPATISSFPVSFDRPLGYIADNDIQSLTEDLYKKDKNNAFRYIAINLQGLKKDINNTDDSSPLRLLTVNPEAYKIPTVKAVLALHDNYELNARTQESITSEELKEESNLLDEFLKTEVLLDAMKFLAGKGFFPNDADEFKDVLRRLWFLNYKKLDNGPVSSSGFENVFLAEQRDFVISPNGVSSHINKTEGLHNWIYFAKQEEANRINYLGHFKEQKLGSNGTVVKLQSSLNGIVQPVTTILVGTSPELEMALYTVCFYTRLNSACQVSLGGSKFWMDTNSLNYYGRITINDVNLDTKDQ